MCESGEHFSLLIPKNHKDRIRFKMIGQVVYKTFFTNSWITSSFTTYNMLKI